MFLHQSVSNVVAHGMSSSEEAKYRNWDVDPELLQDPFDVAQEAEAKRARETEEEARAAASQHYVDLEVGRISVAGMVEE